MSPAVADKSRYRQWSGQLSRALVLENPDPSLDALLGAMGIEVERIPDAPNEDELVAILERGQHQLIYKRSRVQITERVIQASPDLAAVMLCCIGDDSVDKAACAREGVIVTNDPVSNGRSSWSSASWSPARGGSSTRSSRCRPRSGARTTAPGTS